MKLFEIGDRNTEAADQSEEKLQGWEEDESRQSLSSLFGAFRWQRQQ